MVASLKCAGVELHPPESEDIKLLYAWRNDLADLALWSPGRRPIDMEGYRADLSKFESEHVYIRLMIHCQGKIVGTVYAYDANLVHGWVYMAIYIAPEYRGTCTGVGPIAWGLLVEYLFTAFPFRKVYAEVYGFNKRSLNTLCSAGLVIEAKVPNHFFWKGEYYDMFLMALYREDSPNIIVKFLDKRR